MKNLLLSLVVTLIVNISIIYGSPPDNSTIAFCQGISSGFYCQPADALHVVECPGCIAIKCPQGRVCASVGRVSPHYQCELPIDANIFCTNKARGGYCADPFTGFTGIVQCPSGKLQQCPYGSRCEPLLGGFAICAGDHDPHPHPHPEPFPTSSYYPGTSTATYYTSTSIDTSSYYFSTSVAGIVVIISDGTTTVVDHGQTTVVSGSWTTVVPSCTG